WRTIGSVAGDVRRLAGTRSVLPVALLQRALAARTGLTVPRRSRRPCRDGLVEVFHKPELLIEPARLENAADLGADLAENQCAALLAEVALDRHELGQENAIQALRRPGAEAQRQFVAAFAGREVDEFLGQLMNGFLLQPQAVQPRATHVSAP